MLQMNSELTDGVFIEFINFMMEINVMRWAMMHRREGLNLEDIYSGVIAVYPCEE